MKIAMIAACLTAFGVLSLATSAAVAQTSDQQTLTKKCRYGSFITSDGKRRCRRRRPFSGGSHSG